MARHLRMGLGASALLQAGPIGVGSRSGWTQTFDVEDDGVKARVKTVTLVVRDCTIDWILAAAQGVAPSDGFAAIERDFDAWWQTFRLDANPQLAGAPW